MALVFRWDPAKAASNLKRHHVSFEDAVIVFADPLARIFDDAAHSESEAREIIVGHSGTGRLVVVSFTQRGSIIRIISARSATTRERQDYEEGTANH